MELHLDCITGSMLNRQQKMQNVHNLRGDFVVRSVKREEDEQ
jgi:hypothetical protein